MRCLLAPTAHTGFITPSEIDGNYETNLGTLTLPPQFPLNFQLNNGAITSPSTLFALTPSNLNVSINPTNSSGQVSLGTDLTISGTFSGVTGTIDYTIVSSSSLPNLASGNEIIGELTLKSNAITTIDLTDLNPAVLTITFPSLVSLDPHWPPGFKGPVDFTITELPEPASFVHLTWVGVVGAMGYWRRHGRAALAVAA